MINIAIHNLKQKTTFKFRNQDRQTKGQTVIPPSPYSTPSYQLIGALSLMAVRGTVSRFPADPDVLESSGMLWGVAVTPFATKDENGNSPIYGPNGLLIPRCDNCWAYYNTYCQQEQWAWTCSLCGTLNGLSTDAIARYSLPNSAPENMSSFIDLELPLEGSKEEDIQARPVYVAAVDLASSEEFIELTRSALLAALEALAPGSLFGLATISHKIGLYDVQGPIPVIKNIFIPPDHDGTLPLELEDAMPLSSFLAPVETCKDRIVYALETLRPPVSREGTTGTGGMLLGARGFGLAMEALVSYLGSEYGSTFAIGRIFGFLSGPPDYGPGLLDTRRYSEQYASKGQDADRALLPEQTPYYKDLASVAVQSGVCVDIFAVTNEYTDLASLKFLSTDSGGSLFLYPSTDDSTLPQDIYRMLSRAYAFNCVMRLRTSSEFKVENSYGHFFSDPQFENVQHVICCDPYATYAYDFDFSKNTGFSGYTAELPVIQLAFQYSIIVPPDDVLSPQSGLSRRPKYTVQRRIRIRTLQFGSANSINEIYDNTDAEVVLLILVHKVILASLNEGVQEARMLLNDWLIILTANIYKNTRHEYASSANSLTDATLAHYLQLQPLPRLVFALLMNPLLRFHEEGVHPDYRIYIQCLFSGLEPSSLHSAIYPVLTSYDNPDKQVYPRHTLTRAALLTSGSPIFLLDAFTTLVVYYSSTADPMLPYPPPHDCLLRKTINKVKQERCITPKLLFMRAGQDDATSFESYLIEEQDVDGSGVRGFASFLEEITKSVLEYMK